MNLRELGVEELGRRLHDGLRLATGPFTTLIQSRDDQLAATLAEHYPDYPLATDGEFADVAVRVERAWFRRRSGMVLLDDGTPFSDCPRGGELPYLEWGINWCVATRAHRYLMLHAGVVERGGRALILPGLPSAGKSTLCAYLMHHGWRLLSDEFTLIDTGTVEVVPYPRLIPLKNESIDLIRRMVPAAAIGPAFRGTRKGTVAHVCPPDAHLRASAARATPGLIVAPSFRRGAALSAEPMAQSECFIELTRNAFNYKLRGLAGYEAAAAIADAVPAYRLVYTDLGAAAEWLHARAAEHFEHRAANV